MRLVESFLPETVLARTAFELLSSSSISRFASASRAAACIARDAGVRDVPPSVLIQEADTLWRIMAGSKQREVVEVELAVLMVLIADSADTSAEDFLALIASFDSPPVSWIAALARVLMQQRPANANIDLPASASQIPLTEILLTNYMLPASTFVEGGFGVPFQTWQSNHVVDDQTLRAA